MAVDRIRLQGDLDIATVDALLSEVAATTAPHVDLDAAELAFADSTGLRGLLQVRRRLMGEGRRLTISNRSEALTRLFEVAGVVDLFE